MSTEGPSPRGRRPPARRSDSRGETNDDWDAIEAPPATQWDRVGADAGGVRRFTRFTLRDTSIKVVTLLVTLLLLSWLLMMLVG